MILVMDERAFWNIKLGKIRYENLMKETFFFFFYLLTDEFRSKVACENESINLWCSPGYRVAIYSASYGRTEYESLQCPQPNGVKDQSEFSCLSVSFESFDDVLS